MPRDSAYRQIFSGGETRVMPLSTLFTVGARSYADTRLVGRTAARHIDRILLGRIGEAAENEALRTELAAMKGSLSALRTELAAMKGSLAWRMTEPVRRLVGLLRKS